MFTVVKKTPNENNLLEIQIMVEPKNKIMLGKRKKTAYSDLKHRLNSASGSIEKEFNNDKNKPSIASYKGIVFKDIPEIKPQHPNLVNIIDYPDGIFSAINHKKFYFEYVVLEGDISSTAIANFIKRIGEEIYKNEKIKKVVLRLLDKDCLEALKNISFSKNIKLSIEHNEETLTWAKEVLSAKTNIEYHVYGKVNTSEEVKKITANSKVSHKKSFEKTSLLDNLTSVAAKTDAEHPVEEQLSLDKNNQKENSSSIINESSVLNNQSSASVDDSHHTDDEDSGHLFQKETQQLITEDIITSGVNAASQQLTDNSNSNNARGITLKITSSAPEFSINVIKEHLNKLEPEIEKFRSQIKKLQEERNSLEYANKTIQIQNNQLVEENQKLKQMEVYAAVMASSSNSNINLFNQLITHAASAETLRAENNTLRSENSKLMNEINDLNDKKNQALSNNEVLRAEISRLNARISNFESSYNISKAQNEELGKLLEQERARISYLTKLLSSNNLFSNTYSQSINTNADYVAQRKRPYEESDLENISGDQPPSKSPKLAPTSSPGNNNRPNNLHTPFWSSSRSSAEDQRRPTHIEQAQLPSRRYLPILPHATEEPKSRNNSYTQLQGSGIQSNNNAVPGESTISLNSTYPRPSNAK